jgi:hypothetical protein
MLEAYLNWHRTNLLNICAGLTGVELAVDAGAAEAEVRALQQEWQHAARAVDDIALTDTFTWGDETWALRMVYLHMIGEYARHNGHADLLREHLDGVTGR